MEVVDLGALSEIDDLPSNEPSRTGSSNLGSGIELLMNEKKVSSGVDLNLGELDNLENELNEISGNTPKVESNTETKSLSGMASNLFGFGSSTENTNNIHINEEPSDSNLGQATRDSIGTAKTWDGFSKMTEMPLNE